MRRCFRFVYFRERQELGEEREGCPKCVGVSLGLRTPVRRHRGEGGPKCVGASLGSHARQAKLERRFCTGFAQCEQQERGEEEERSDERGKARHARGVRGASEATCVVPPRHKRGGV